MLVASSFCASRLLDATRGMSATELVQMHTYASQSEQKLRRQLHSRNNSASGPLLLGTQRLSPIRHLLYMLGGASG